MFHDRKWSIIHFHDQSLMTRSHDHKLIDIFYKDPYNTNISAIALGMYCMYRYILETGHITVNIIMSVIMFQADSRFAPSLWEKSLLCNDVSHWWGVSLESDLMLWLLFLVMAILSEKAISWWRNHRWIPLTKASDEEFWWFLWSVPEQTIE